MAEISPLRRRMIEDDGPQSVTGDATILPQRLSEVEPIFRSFS